MPHIITITGPSGSGKSTTLFNLLDEKCNLFDPVMIPKHTTRSPHNDDHKEVICGGIPIECDLKYVQYGAYYGIALCTIFDHITEGKSPIVILNDVRAVEDVRNVFGGIVRSLFIFRESPTEDRFRIIADMKGLSEKEFKGRFQKSQTLYRIYIENIHIFDHVIINSGTRNDLKTQVKGIISGLQQSQHWPLTKRNKK